MIKSGPRPLSVVVAGVCVVSALILAWLAGLVNAHSNHRLLVQQVQQAAATLSGALPVVQSQLVDAAQVAIDTDANPQTFQRFVAANATGTGAFAAISLWKLSDGGAQRVAIRGGSLALVSQHRDTAFFAHVHPSTQLFVTGILSGSVPRLGYAEMPPGDTAGLVVYSEGALPPNRRITIPAASPFADLRIALYLGPKPVTAQLLEATGATPITGAVASTSLPFGNTVITLVGASNTRLTGPLSAALPWIVLGGGAALALTSGSVVEYGIRRRMLAEGLALDNDRLYHQQRDIAGSLQHALLPQLPVIEGLQISARYVAGVTDLDVGGDWYDVIATAPGRCVFFVGDVSGRGLGAATIMASLRYAIRAYTAHGDDIHTVLRKLDALLDIERDEHFATVLAGDIDLNTHQVTLVCAGHFFPLLLSDGRAEFITGPVGPPIGIAIASPTDLATTTFVMPAGATLIAFTDGLVERRDESIDTGLDRLRRTAASP